MRILAIDTATEACSAALWNDGTLSAHFEICPREHTQRILPLVQEVLTESGTTLSELDALAFGRGEKCTDYLEAKRLDAERRINHYDSI